MADGDMGKAVVDAFKSALFSSARMVGFYSAADSLPSLNNYQPSMACISAAILIVAKLEKVSETAYGKMI